MRHGARNGRSAPGARGLCIHHCRRHLRRRGHRFDGLLPRPVRRPPTPRVPPPRPRRPRPAPRPLSPPACRRLWSSKPPQPSSWGSLTPRGQTTRLRCRCLRWGSAASSWTPATCRTPIRYALWFTQSASAEAPPWWWPPTRKAAGSPPSAPSSAINRQPAIPPRWAPPSSKPGRRPSASSCIPSVSTSTSHRSST